LPKSQRRRVFIAGRPLFNDDLGYGETSGLTAILEEVSRMLNAYASAILASDS
jgi:hypothetical protein